MQWKCIAAATLIAVAGLLLPLSVRAEGGASAPDGLKQVELTDAHVQGYIAVQRDLQPGTADPKLRPDYEAIAKKHGFESFAEYSEVADNIAMVMVGLDDKGVYTDPKTTIEEEIAAVAVNKDMSADEKTRALTELTEALKGAIPVKYPRNIEIVRKYRADLDKVM